MEIEEVWWLSFADENGFLGGALIQANSFVEAVTKTHLLGINPGGEVQGVRGFTGDSDDIEMDRLYSKAEIESELGGIVSMRVDDGN